jgi:FG-GAP-like repeat
VDQEFDEPACIEREYRTERDPFAKIVAYCGPTGDPEFYHPSAAPEYFRVWTKDGRVLTFGEWNEDVRARMWAYRLRAGPTADTGIPSLPSLERDSDARVPVVWALNRIADRNGNEITIDYRHAEDMQNLWAVDMWPHAINYGPSRGIRFYYEARPDKLDRFEAGVHSQSTGRLNRIAMYGRSSTGRSVLIREYRLSYDSNSITGRSLLASITECDGNGTCLRPLEFGWSLGSYEFDIIDTGITDAGTSHFSGHRIIAADVNGDGGDDIVYPDAENNWRIRFSNGSGFGPSVLAGIPRVGSAYRAGIRPIDFDRDGRMDFMVEVSDQPGRTDWYLYQSTGSSYVKYAPDVDDGHFQFPHAPVYFADLDGNGMPDYATARFHSTNGKIAGSRWHYRLNSGSSGPNRFLGMIQTDQERGADARIRVLDADGDGRAELLRGWLADNWFETVGLNADGGSEVLPVNLVTWLPSIDQHFADINGDGLVDAVYVNGLATQVNSGRGFGPLIEGPADYVEPYETEASDFSQGFRIVDFNNDGRQDILIWHHGTPAGATDYFRGLQLYVWGDDGFKRVALNRSAGQSFAILGWPATQPLDIDGNGVLDLVQGYGRIWGMRWEAGYPR